MTEPQTPVDPERQQQCRSRLDSIVFYTKALANALENFAPIESQDRTGVGTDAGAADYEVFSATFDLVKSLKAGPPTEPKKSKAKATEDSPFWPNEVITEPGFWQPHYTEVRDVMNVTLRIIDHYSWRPAVFNAETRPNLVTAPPIPKRFIDELRRAADALERDLRLWDESFVRTFGCANPKTPPAPAPAQQTPPPAADLAPSTLPSRGTPPTLDLKRFRRGPDYRDCTWNGQRYTFTPTQAACVKVLWEAWENGTPEVGQATVLEIAGSDSQKLKDPFKKHPAWGTMIVEGSTAGSYRLAEPT